MAHQENVGEVGVVEFEVSFVVELEKSRTVGMVILEVEVVEFGFASRVTAFLTHIDFGTALFVGVAVLDAMHLQAVRFQGAPLGERLLTQVAFIWTNTCMRSGVSLEIEGIVEAFSTESAKVSLNIRMTFHVSVQQTLESEGLGANSAHVLAAFIFDHLRRRR